MAFPAIQGTATTNGTTATTTPVVNLPTGIVSGETLLVLIRVASAGVIDWPAGWTELFDDASDASNDQTAAAYRKADGTEGATITLSSASAKFAALAWRINAAADPTVTAPQFATLAVGTSANPNPGSLSPTGGAKDYLWLAVGGWEGEQTSPPGTFPASYTLNQIGADSGIAGLVATNCRVAGAGRQLNAATEDPGTYTISASDDWTATTIAVHPSVAQTFFQTLPATAVGVATLSRVATYPRTLAAVAVGVATLSKVPTYVQTLAATATGVATLSRVATYSRTLAATAVGVASLTKGMFTTLAATAVGVPTLSTVFTTTKTLAATAVGVASLTATFIAGGAGAAVRSCAKWLRL